MRELYAIIALVDGKEVHFEFVAARDERHAKIKACSMFSDWTNKEMKVVHVDTVDGYKIVLEKSE